MIAESFQLVDSPSEADNILAVDVSNMAHRAAWGYKNLSLPDGTPTGHVFGSVRLMVSTLCNELWPGRWCIAYCYDGHGATAERQKVLATYKANRDYTNRINPVTDVKVVLRCLPGLHVEASGREGDDAIAKVVNMSAPKMPTVLLTADRDLQGLLAYPQVQVLSPTLKRFVVQGDYQKAYLVTDPAKIYLAKALFGDKSDGISGVFRLMKRHVEPLLNRPGILTAEDFYENLLISDVPETTKTKLLDAQQQVLTNYQVIRPDITKFGPGTIKKVRGDCPTFDDLMRKYACHSIPGQAGILFGEPTYVKDRR